ncbi:ATPase family AAA domain-containing protein 1-A [Glycine max]|nr:ATPase family AAA domain-containing protein 1-A [Glycine max]
MVGPPYVENMEKILRTLLAKEKVDNELEFKELATMTEGYTGSDLKNLCTIAAYRPVRELIQQERLKSLVSGNCIIYFEFNWYDLKILLLYLLDIFHRGIEILKSYYLTTFS